MTDSTQTIRADLFAMRDVGYAEFQARLMPNIPLERIIGIRTPLLRAYAKKLKATKEANDFLASLPHPYYDENNLHAALLEQIGEFDTALAKLEKFLPYIDNWATCDMFCPKILQRHPDLLWDRIQLWLSSDRVYTIRYALVRMTTWYLEAPLFSTAVLDAAAKCYNEDYYVRMAVAWLFSIALIKQYEATLSYLLENKLSPWIHNKTIQKAVESYRIPTDIKGYLKTLKRKE